jgi:hypothetical protein
MTPRIFFTKYVPAALFLATTLSACNLQRALPDVSPQYIVITATGGPGPGETAAPNQIPEPSATSTETPVPTNTFTPTITPTATIALPTMTAGQKLSCVKGPHWILYEWVAGIDKGETVTLLARATLDWPDYYYIRKSDGTECWAYGGSSTISGDPSTLPFREAPPLPEVKYTIENKTGLNVNTIRIRVKDSADWGPDRLGAPLAPGSTFSLTLTAGFYDVLVQDAWAGALYQKDDYPIGSDANYRNIVLDDEFEFYLQNNFGFDLCTFNVQPVGGSWKAIHLPADGAVTPGSRITFKLLPAKYNLRIWRCSGPLVVNFPGLYFGPAVAGYPVS